VVQKSTALQNAVNTTNLSLSVVANATDNR
jgi:hypothetical protein